jgi:uncharacterized protein YbaP (TraB family)
MKIFRHMVATAALFPLALCSPLTGTSPAQAQTAPAPAETEDADPALWVVKDADTILYLFGTVHMLKPGLSWFDEAVKEAFDKSDRLVIEVVLPDDQAAMAAKIIPLAIDQTGKSLSSQLTDSARAAYEAVMNKYGLPVGQFDAFEPWFPGMTLSAVILQSAGFLPDLGSEKVLSAAAKAAGKPIAGLESLEEQMGFFDTLPREDQLKFLNDAVAQEPKVPAEFSEILFAWARGNPDDLALRMNRAKQGSERLASVLLFERNERWAKAIKAKLEEPGTQFIAVGAGHLAGEKSVQEYLKAIGIAAERVAY